MLFKQIYNWIKYKTLPPSFLFKNRLFIERDSKTKRIFSNFGLVFRQSKWNAYQINNIQTPFKKFFLRFFLFIVVFIYLFIKSNNFYILSYYFNFFFFFIWFFIDLIDYYFSFLFWSIFSFTFLIKNIVHSYFFFNNFNQNKNITPSNFSSSQNNNFENKNYSNKDYKWFLMEWLNTKSKSKIKITILESLFDIEKNNWHAKSLFFCKLFNANFLINKDFYSNQMNLFELQNKIQQNYQTSLINYLNQTTYLTKYTSLVFYFFLNKNIQNFQNNSSLNFLKNRYFWNLSHFFNNSPNDHFLLKNFNNFYLKNTNVSFFLNFTENLFLNEILFLENNFAKWNRWLYKYSLLHRKSFKNLHKITLTKKMLNSNFCNIDLTKKNLWLSEILNKTHYTNLLHISSNLLQFDLLNKNEFTHHNYKNLLTNNHQFVTNLNLLKNYENSFFWFFKRIYFFSSLANNFNFSNLIFTNNKPLLKIQNTIQMKNYPLTFLLSALDYQLNFFLSPNKSFNELNFNYDKNKDSNTFYLIFNEKDLLQIDNLNMLLWIVSPSSKNHLSYNNLNNFSYFYTNYQSSFLLESSVLLQIYFNFNNEFLFKNHYLKDITFLTLFN